MFGKQCKHAYEQLLATSHRFFGMPHAKAIVVAHAHLLAHSFTHSPTHSLTHYNTAYPLMCVEPISTRNE